MPKIHPTAWVAPGAFVRGDVTIDEQANIWYNAVLRGDQESITVGKATSVQDNCAGSIVGAGAVVAAGTIVPPKSLVVGVPGKVKKTLTDEDVAGSIANAESYLGLMAKGMADPENQK